MKKIAIDSFLEFSFPSSPRISPDGRYTAFVVQKAELARDRYVGDLYLVENHSGEVKRLTARGDAKSFTWTPDKTLLFPSACKEESKSTGKVEGPSTDYYEIDPKGGEAFYKTSLPHCARVPTILEDGRWVVTARVDLNRPNLEALHGNARKEAMEAYQNPRYEVFEEVPFWGDGQGYVSRRRNTLFLCDPKTGETAPITPKLFQVSQSDVAYGKVAYTGSEFDDVAPYYEGVYLYDIATGETRCLVEEGRFKAGKPVFLDSQTIVMSLCPKEAHTYAFGDFYRIDLETGKLTMIAAYDSYIGVSSRVNSDARLGTGQTIKADGGKLWFVSTEEEGHYIRSIDRDGNLSGRLTQPGSTDQFDVLDGLTVFTGFRGNKLPELYFLEEDAERRITGFNEFVGEQYQISTPVPLSYTGSDGFEIRGWVMPPVGYEKGKKYPAIFHIHGGPKTVFGSIFHHEMQVWANAGYFVLFSNPRGSDGRGLAFADIKGILGTVDYVNQMEFVDECLRLWPDIDPKRLGVTGGSYGGNATNWIIGHTDRFRAACAQRSVSNWLGFEGTSDGGYFSNRVQHGAMLEEDAEKLWALSPLKYAHNAKTPTLFIHSDQDYRCPMPEALQMFTALRLHGVESKVVLFHGECHELSRSGRPRNRITRMKEILCWFDRFLKPTGEEA